MVYTPVLVTETELRNAFDPALTVTELSQTRALTIIEMVETYIRDTYFDGTMPSATTAKMPAIAIAISKVIGGNSLLQKGHKTISSFKIDNYSVKYENCDSASDWFNMAHRVLMTQDMKARSEYIVKVNK